MMTFSVQKQLLFLGVSAYFLSSCAATGVTSGEPTHLQEPELSQSENHSNRPSEVTFETVLTGDGVTFDRHQMAFTNYKSSNGNNLYRTWIYFDTQQHAASKILDLLEHALKTIRKSPESSKNGRQVGERILVIRRGKSEEETEAILAWTRNAIYQEIRSKSLDDVIAFEKHIRPATD